MLERSIHLPIVESDGWRLRGISPSAVRRRGQLRGRIPGGMRATTSSRRPTLTVTVRTTVVWTNVGGVEHNIVAVDGSFGSAILNTGPPISSDSPLWWLGISPTCPTSTKAWLARSSSVSGRHRIRIATGPRVSSDNGYVPRCSTCGHGPPVAASAKREDPRVKSLDTVRRAASTNRSPGAHTAIDTSVALLRCLAVRSGRIVGRCDNTCYASDPGQVLEVLK